ncbi:hypothetical protein K458DRAFT_485517 [Lentithecium fluviatile CBS 122367]|uniref:Uncharacterized protein n=1 Tax=Lentithecium fluviatile CBS 122367 TaxID=1168545 RepID=A0A6G1J9P1_9PLEO|nr:hypothetical protein K458DRAFT_485517 [Lentithecium fluviatile CBS 122367]
MFQPAIGDYCLFIRPDSPSPPWPALICTDDMAPRRVSDSRLPGYNHLVLLIKDEPEFCYALTTELGMFDFPDRDELGQSYGLERAYDLVLSAMDHRSTLDYWAMMTENQRMQNSVPKHGWSSPSEDSDSDQEIREAKRRSRVDLKRGDKTTLPTPSVSPPKRRPCGWRHVSPGFPEDIRRHFLPVTDAATTASSSQGPSTSLLKQSPDVVEGLISESKEFVEFLVGPDKEPFSIPSAEIKRRLYFHNKHHGYMRAKGEQGWTIELPGLELVSPEDFRHVADFLSTGTFGHRVIDDNNRAEAMAQLVAAWEIAERYGMDDLLGHIVSKIEECMPWDPVEVLAFAIVVYGTEGSWLEEIENMKKMLTEYMAGNFYEMIEELPKDFLFRLRQIPELQRDVHRRIANNADERAEAAAQI